MVKATPPTRRKVCRACRDLKPIEEYYTGQAVCKICQQMRRSIARSEGPAQYLKGLFAQMVYSQTKRKGVKGRTQVEIKITVEDLVRAWEKQDGKCAISGVVLTHHKDGSGKKDFNASIDRIIPHDPYVAGNVQLVAYRVNVMKHELTEDLFYWWVRTIHDNFKNSTGGT